MLSSISSLQSFNKYSSNINVQTFVPTSFSVTGSFSMIRMTWNSYSSLSNATGKIFRIIISRVDGNPITTRYYAYIRSSTSTTNILTTFGSVNSANSITISFTSTTNVLLNALTECILTGFTYNTNYNIILEADSNVSTVLSRTFNFKTSNYETNEIPPDAMKYLPWKRNNTVNFYKANITPETDNPTNWTLTAFTNTQLKGFNLFREDGTGQNIVGSFPDQVTRAIDISSGADIGALSWGIQSQATGKYNISCYFQSSTNYVLSCMTLTRSTDSNRNSIYVYLDPNSNDTTGSILMGTINQPVISTTNWLYTSFSYTTPPTFTSGLYYLRITGVSASDLVLRVSNCEIVRTT